MVDRKQGEKNGSSLRNRAEARLPHLTAIESLSREQVERLIHELEVHQVELEMQNEELRRTQIELVESKAKYIALYDHAPSGYLTLDSAGRVLQANLTASTLLGVSHRQLVQVPLFRHLSESETSKLELYLATVFSTGESQCCELELETFASGIRYVSLESNPVQSKGIDSQHCQVSVLDVSSRKNAELELLRHRDQLEVLVAERTQELDSSRREVHRADRLASLGTLAAGLAHELNNPLGIIRLRADGAMLENNIDEYRSALASIVEQVTRSAEIVTGVLSFAREEGPTFSRIDLGGIVRRSVELTDNYAVRAQVEIECQIDDGPAFVFGSATKLEQVVVNLIRNAIEASSPEDHVTVSMPRLRNLMRVTVSDQGQGMSEEAREHAFDPFYTTKREEGGTGLGLSVAHGIIEQHSGSMNIKSEVGKGTTVALELAAHINPSRSVDID